jgi:uracil-DNA glycosylase family protein
MAEPVNPFVPDTNSLRELRRTAADCRACPLHGPATQTVFSDGPRRAELMLVGEMPGDREDLAGHVFVGPAGRELDAALEQAGIARADAYLTNAVKHFKFHERGKRRIHDSPKKSEIDACLPWLERELRLVRPRVLVLLGAVAAKALLGSSFRLTAARGERLDSDLAPVVMATIHPAAILRARDTAARVAEREGFTRDLRRARALLEEG